MNKDKVTVVLLPGLNGTVGLFKPMIDNAPDDFEVLALSYPTHEKLSYQQLIPFVINRLEEISGKYILVGESFSGPLSIFISHKHPQGLIGTILVATFITAPYHRIGRFIPWQFGFTLIKPLYSLRLMVSRRKYAPLIKVLSKELQKVSPDVLADRIQSIFAVNAQKQLRECSIPLIYFRGNKDIVVPRYNLNNILAIKPDIKVVRFNTQHLLLQTAPKQAWQAISSFIAEIMPDKSM